MRIHLGGHLSWYDPQKRSWLDVKLSEPTALLEVLQKLGVPAEEIAVGALNGAAMLSLENVRVTDADRVELFPPVGGGAEGGFHEKIRCCADRCSRYADRVLSGGAYTYTDPRAAHCCADIVHRYAAAHCHHSSGCD